jgi:hypothetical protein
MVWRRARAQQGPGGASMGDPAVAARSSLPLRGPGRLIDSLSFLFLFLFFSLLFFSFSFFIQERFSYFFNLLINYLFIYLFIYDV